MKKIAMLLALVLCVMMATTAMAEVYFEDCTPKERFIIPATAINADFSTNEENGSSSVVKLTDQFRLLFDPANLDGFHEDCNVRPVSTPMSNYLKAGGDLMRDIRKAMQEELANHFEDGETVKYMYFDVECEAYVQTYGEKMEWKEMGVPTHRHSWVWAESLTGTADYSLFGGKPKKVKAVYSVFTLSEENNSGEFSADVNGVDLVETNAGLQMTFKHLSPVMIAWTEYPAAAQLEAPDMPSTGDSSSLPGLFILLGLSIAAMGAMKLRRREN